MMDYTILFHIPEDVRVSRNKMNIEFFNQLTINTFTTRTTYSVSQQQVLLLFFITA